MAPLGQEKKMDSHGPWHSPLPAVLMRSGPSPVRALACAALLALAAPAWALDPGRAITQYVHEVFQAEQGLPQNSVGAMTQTRDGNTLHVDGGENVVG